MRDQSIQSSPQRQSHLLSTLLFIAALAFAAAAVVLWYLDDSNPDREPPIPTAVPGMYGLVNVLQELEATGIDGDYGRSPAAADANQLPTPGQHLKVNGHSAWVFIFTGAGAEAAASARSTAADGVDLATLTLTTRTSGADLIDGQPVTMYEGANVIVLLVGADAETQELVQAAIEGLA